MDHDLKRAELILTSNVTFYIGDIAKEEDLKNAVSKVSRRDSWYVPS